MSNILAIIDATPVPILIGVNAATTAAIIAVYRDCQRERAALWAHVKELEKRIGK